VIDVQVPTDPALVASWTRPAAPEVEAVDVAFSGRHLVVADHSYEAGRLRVLDVSDPRRPMELGYASLPSDAVALAVVPGIAVVAHATLVVDVFVDGGLTVVDLTDPSEPTVRGTYFVNGSVWGVAADEGAAYLLTDGVLAVVDISEPAAPVEIATYGPSGSYFRAVDLFNGVAFAVGSSGTMFVAVGGLGVDGYRLGSCRAPRRPTRRATPLYRCH